MESVKTGHFGSVVQPGYTRMNAIRPTLIFDIGMYDGGDSAYYLFQGYNVIAVDANPLMVELAKARFAQDIEAKRLTVLNVGISDLAGSATFWVSDVPEWSSFDKDIASRDGTSYRPLVVPVLPFAELLSTYGTPYYLKIDIEGNDRFCIEALQGRPLPKYISVEAECVGDSTVLSDEDAVAMLELLHSVGYNKFKLVHQSGWIPARPFAGGSISCQVPLLTSGFDFSRGSTGPWGETIACEWMPFGIAKNTYLRARHLFFASKERPLYSFWFDWHATH